MDIDINTYSVVRKHSSCIGGIMDIDINTYSVVRKHMKSGDIIAFSGKGGFSEIIKTVTAGPVSHVGVIRQAHLIGDDGRYFNEVIESTQMGDKNGVCVSRLSTLIDIYDGCIWWLPLVTNRNLDRRKFFDFLYAQEGKTYDMPQAILSAIDGPFGIGENKEDFGRLFCSELVTGALEAAGFLPTINASEVTPMDLVKMRIYGGCIQLKGPRTDIPEWNTVSVL